MEVEKASHAACLHASSDAGVLTLQAKNFAGERGAAAAEWNATSRAVGELPEAARRVPGVQRFSWRAGSMCAQLVCELHRVHVPLLEQACEVWTGFAGKLRSAPPCASGIKCGARSYSRLRDASALPITLAAACFRFV